MAAHLLVSCLVSVLPIGSPAVSPQQGDFVVTGVRRRQAMWLSEDGGELGDKVHLGDLYFRELVNRVPAGATFTMVCDSPQSGGLIDQEKEQIGPAAAANAIRTDGVNADAGILLSGCQKDEQVAEIAPEDCGGKRYGAFTWALQAVLKADRAPMSNLEVVRRAREVVSEELIKRGLELRQKPCLYCSDANADAPFLGQQDTKAAKSN